MDTAIESPRQPRETAESAGLISAEQVDEVPAFSPAGGPALTQPSVERKDDALIDKDNTSGMQSSAIRIGADPKASAGQRSSSSSSSRSGAAKHEKQSDRILRTLPDELLRDTQLQGEMLQNKLD